MQKPLIDLGAPKGPPLKTPKNPPDVPSKPPMNPPNVPSGTPAKPSNVPSKSPEEQPNVSSKPAPAASSSKEVSLLVQELSRRRDEYKKAAVQAKKQGDLATAREYLLTFKVLCIDM